MGTRENWKIDPKIALARGDREQHFWSPHCRNGMLALERVQRRLTSMLSGMEWFGDEESLDLRGGGDLSHPESGQYLEHTAGDRGGGRVTDSIEEVLRPALELPSH